MADVSVVKTPEDDPKKGKPRPKSGVSFPYYSLTKSIDVARLIHESAGGRCDRAQLAALLGYSGVKNGGFLARISASKMFGLVEEYGEAVVLSECGKCIISATRTADAEKAKLDAFLNVELYRRVFEQFDGQVLPSEVGLKNLLENQYGVVSKQVEPALRNMLDSADTAGFFRVTGNRSKMVRPIIQNDVRVDGGGETGDHKGEGGPNENERNRETGHHAESPRKHRGGGGGGDDGHGIDPALLGLLRNLPAPGSQLGPKRRAALIEAFKSTINFIYPEDEEEVL